MARKWTLFLILIYTSSISLQAKPNSSTGRKGGLDRTSAAIALHKMNLQRQAALGLTALEARGIKDQGNVSIVQDDGTLIMPMNRFDLAGRSLTFTPQGQSYQLVTAASAFDTGQNLASTVPLDDDDAVSLDLPFPFTFFGVTYHSVFLNTDGNLTFGVPDGESTDRNLRRVVDGPPRIAPLFDDLTPSSTGRITMEKLSDRVLIDWLTISEYGYRARNTFQLVLRSNGVIQFNYNTMNVTEAVVGLSAGKGAALQAVDFSLQTSGTAVSGIVAEVFSPIEQLDLAAVSTLFYTNHRDAYDALIVFSDFDIDLQEAFAYEFPVRNDVQGIMPDYGTFDLGDSFGATHRLSSMVNAGSIGQYPTDPQEIFLGSNNTLEVLGQEFGHRWLAFLDTTPSSMLGRDYAHWSFFMNTEGSVMEGNQIQDLGNGQFKTIGATFRYSPLDQYVMGLRAPSEVPPWFVVSNPRLVSAPPDFDCLPINAACGPSVGVTLSGTRKNITIDDVISIAGPRVPAYPAAQKDFSAAFVLITRKGAEPSAKSIAHIDNIRKQWEQFFDTAVENRGTMSTTLLYPGVTDLSLSLPANGSIFTDTPSTGSLDVGYGVLHSAFGVAVLRSFSGSSLVSEAAVPASQTAARWMMYAEKTPRLSTGIAMANPTGVPANLTLSLSTGKTATLQIPAHAQRAAFVEQLFGGLDDFLGTLTIQSDVAVAVLALRGTQNAKGNFIMSTIPLSSAVPENGGVTAFPIVADGGGYNTEIILVNSGTAISTGTVRFVGLGAPVDFSIPAGTVWKFQTTNATTNTISGSASVVVNSGPMPDGTAVIRYSSANGLISETGFPAQRAIASALIFASLDPNLRTGLALLNASTTDGAQIRLTARGQSGELLAASSVVMLAAGSRISAYVDQMISGLPASFSGMVTIESNIPVYASSLRGTTTPDGYLMAAMPLRDTSRLLPEPGYFPQIAIGGGFSTDFLIGNAGAAAAQISFIGSMGQPLSVTLQ